MEVVIRDMEPDEVEDITGLWLENDLPYKPGGRDRKENLLEEMKEPQNRFLIAEMDGSIVGTVLVTHDGRKGWINRLSVDERYRRRGIGRSLIGEAEKWLGSQRIGIFACLVESENLDSMLVFEALGYQEFEGVRYFTKRLDPDI